MPTSCLTVEARRLDALYKLNLLDTPASEAFDRITRMAANLFKLPIAAISLTDADRQWFKSRVGVEHDSIPRMRAPCGQVADSSDVLVIPDLAQDDYYRNSVLAEKGIRYYAGAPLTTTDGHCLGAMCVLGTEPRDTTPEELTALCDLAGMVMAQIELQHALGRVDAVSGLPNRHQFIEDFDDLQLDAGEGEQRLAVLLNLATPDQLTHAARAMKSTYLDELVTEGARWLRAEIGPGHRMYHVATAQFMLLSSPGETLASWLPRVEARMQKAQIIARSHHMATPSAGVVPFDVNHDDALSVLRKARSAAFDAMASPNHVAVYSQEEDALYQRRFSLLNDFSAALQSRDQLRLVFQPRIDVASGECIGAEALLRWIHPTLGAIGPAEFIPIVERSGLAQATTAWVLEEALRHQQAWRHAGLALQVSVNVSAANLTENGFAASVAACLARHHLPADCLELEITESAIMEQPVKAHATLAEIAALGVGLAIDDFGTGYSSLSYLQKMPADVVKIDQSFIRNLERDTRQQALVTAMITLSQDLGHRVVAEGVESDAVLAFLRHAGCEEAQGYLFAAPLEAADFAAYSCPISTSALRVPKLTLSPRTTAVLPE
ncbi:MULTISPECIES: EAL domain-containing protein [unclassified Duganella]|uniref:bifunctional diguanylate cyclase/phosphodiesterase n=1 Tax=unclassified Duganella TaxID=2636909 RepID=UPI00088CB561|nr:MULTISPECIES: EAL domain-containing protein [unclassified Duganella]SDF97004.1 EAL domain, c-di-GMP-specific phosphodiesterase class I (or its enzymatically inactive variant) [Duganella sp. OV458]SDJ07706.1 EAL domain, c-di-GMP-specific phosphodiesterase class I (or its enzymatically inactive variant) [Duganella sp. OV510]